MIFFAIKIRCLRENTQKIEGPGKNITEWEVLEFCLILNSGREGFTLKNEAEIPQKNLYVRT